MLNSTTALTENDGNFGTLGASEWDWDTNLLYVNIGGDPTGGNIEANQRDNIILINTKNYITVQDIVLRNGNENNFDVAGLSSGIIVNDCESYGADNDGFKQAATSTATYNSIIGSNNGDDGLSLHRGATAVVNTGTFSGNVSGVNNIFTAQITLDNVTVSNNTSYGVWVLYAANGTGGTTTITSSTFTSNASNIQFENDQSGSITNTTITGGTTGIYTDSTGTIALSNVTSTNQTGDCVYVDGGSITTADSTSLGVCGDSAIDIDGASTVTVTETTISSTVGHAIDTASGTTLTIDNLVLFSIPENKFAIAVRDGVTSTIRNSVLYNNDRGLFIQSTTTLYNTILFDHEEAIWFSGAGNTSELTMSHNNMYSNTTDFQGGDGSEANLDGIAQDPLFMSTSTNNFTLQASSPCIDRGTSNTSTPTTDYLGKQRYDQPSVADGGAGTLTYYDIGAYENVLAIDPVLQSTSHASEVTWYNDTTPDMSLTSDDSSTTHYHYLVNQTASPTAAQVAAGTEDADGTFSVAAETIDDSGTWYVHIISQNADNENSTNFDTYTIKYDGDAPTGAAISFGTITTSSIALSTSAASDDNAGLHATPYYFLETVASSTDGWQASTDWTVSSLSVNTLYTFQVKTKDNATTSNESSLTTATSKYTLATAPSSVITTGGSGQITVAWSSSSTSHYIDNMTDDVNSGWTSDSTYTFTGLNCSRSYSFRVKARNGDNTETSYSSTVSGQTNACVFGGSGGSSSSVPATPAEDTTDEDTTQESSADALATSEVSLPPGTSESISIGGSTHTITVGTPAEDGTVTITIESDPVTVTLAPGEEELVDTDSDGEYDLLVKLDSSDASVVDLTVVAVGELEFSIAQGLSEVSSQAVLLYMNSTGVTEMAISNENDFTNVSYVDYTTTSDWTLTEGNGVKTVYVKFRSTDGGTTNTNDTITLTGQSFDQEIVVEEVVEEEVECDLTKGGAYKHLGSPAVYYITSDCTKRAFKRSDVFFTYFDGWSDVVVITETEIDAITNDTLGFMPWGPKYDPKYGALVKIVTDPKVYLLLGTEKYWITSEVVFETLNYAWNWIEDIAEGLLDKYTLGSEISYTDHHPNYTLIKYEDNPKVYRLEPDPEDTELQVKRYIPDEPTFESLNFRWDRIVTVGEAEEYTDGELLTELAT